MPDEIEIQAPPPYGCLPRRRCTVSGRYRTDTAKFEDYTNLRIEVTVTGAAPQSAPVAPTTAWDVIPSVIFSNLGANEEAVVTARLLTGDVASPTELHSDSSSPVRLRDSCISSFIAPDPAATRDSSGHRTAHRDAAAPLATHRTVTTNYPYSDEARVHRIVVVVVEKAKKGRGVPTVWSVVEATFRLGVAAATVPLPDPDRKRSGFEYAYYFLMLDPGNRIDSRTPDIPDRKSVV